MLRVQSPVATKKYKKGGNANNEIQYTAVRGEGRSPDITVATGRLSNGICRHNVRSVDLYAEFVFYIQVESIPL